MQFSAFTPYGNSYRLDLTTSTANAQITLQPGQSPQQVWIINTGANAAFVELSWGSAAAAVAPTVGTPANGAPIPAANNFPVVLTIPGQLPGTPATLFLSGITAASTTTIYFMVGDGH